MSVYIPVQMNPKTENDSKAKLNFDLIALSVKDLQSQISGLQTSVVSSGSILNAVLIHPATTARNTVVPTSDIVNLTLKSIAGQTANHLQGQNSSGVNQWAISPSGASNWSGTMTITSGLLLGVAATIVAKDGGGVNRGLIALSGSDIQFGGGQSGGAYFNGGGGSVFGQYSGAGVWTLGVAASTATNLVVQGAASVSDNLGVAGNFTLTGSAKNISFSHASDHIISTADGNLTLRSTKSTPGSLILDAANSGEAGASSILFQNEGATKLTIDTTGTLVAGIGGTKIVGTDGSGYLTSLSTTGSFGSVMLSASPTTTGTLTGASSKWSGSVLVGTTSVVANEILRVNGSTATNGVARFENAVNSTDVNHGILNLVNTATYAVGNDARIMFSFKGIGGGASAIDPVASIGAVAEGAGLAYQAGLTFNTRSASGVFTQKMGISSGGAVTIVGAFGCNGSAAQTSAASGGALAAYSAGTSGLDSGAHMSALHALVVAMRSALVANGIMS